MISAKKEKGILCGSLKDSPNADLILSVAHELETASETSRAQQEEVSRVLTYNENKQQERAPHAISPMNSVLTTSVVRMLNVKLV